MLLLFSGPDTTPPSVTVEITPDVFTVGGTTYDLQLTFSDDAAIDVDTLQTGNVLVLGPNGFVVTPTLQSVDVGTDGTPRVATYRFTPPGGSWDASDAGSYQVWLAGV